MYCPHFATSDGIIRFCMKGYFPCDCENCICPDKRLVDITTTNNTKDLFKVEIKMTIEEMAEKYVNDAYSHPVDKNVGKADFILGANAVLKEIEKVFTADYPSIFMATQAMRDKINELKGKE